MNTGVVKVVDMARPMLCLQPVSGLECEGELSVTSGEMSRARSRLTSMILGYEIRDDCFCGVPLFVHSLVQLRTQFMMGAGFR